MKHWVGICVFGFSLVWLLIFSLVPKWAYLIHIFLALLVIWIIVKYCT